MSKPNLLTNTLVLDDVYAYRSHSDFINNIKAPKFSRVCVFCSHHDSFPLLNDGSFRCCLRCKKNFKAKI